MQKTSVYACMYITALGTFQLKHSYIKKAAAGIFDTAVPNLPLGGHMQVFGSKLAGSKYA